jgi:hypothetical protein
MHCALVAVDPNDPVVRARREGCLAVYLRDALDAVVGQPLTHIGRTLNIVELGFGDDVAAPTPRRPDRVTEPHIFHCQCAVEIDHIPVLADEIAPHRAWLSGFDVPPCCVAIDANESGELRLTLTDEHVLTVRPNGDEHDAAVSRRVTSTPVRTAT